MPLLGEYHSFLVLLSQHYEAEKQHHITLADLRASSALDVHQKKKVFYQLTVAMVASLVVVARRK